MSYGLLKAHHGIMKMTALQDYEYVANYCRDHGLIIEIPKGKHWHKIEDATAVMIKNIGTVAAQTIPLNRGFEYYFSI